MYQNTISFAGAGRVAEALCKELFHAGFKIDMVVSENEAQWPSLWLIPAKQCGRIRSVYFPILQKL
jgi:hypothetical protein